MAIFRRGKNENGLTRRWIATLSDHVISCSWSPDGSKVAAAVVSGPITIFASDTGAVLAELPGHSFGTTMIDWQPQGDLLASAGQDGTIRLWNGSTGALQHVLPAGAAWAEHVRWEPNGRRLATAAGKSVRVWSPQGELTREYKDHAATVLDLKWKPQSDQLSVASYGGIQLYDLVQPKAVQSLAWKGSPLALAWSPDGRLCAHGNQDSTVHFWYADEAKPLQMYGFPTKVRELSFDWQSRYLATGGGAALCIWDCGGRGPEGRKPMMLFNEDSEALLTACAWQARGAKVVATFADGAVHVWQPTAKGAHVGNAHMPESEAVSPAWSPNDRRLIIGSSQGYLACFEVSK